MKNEIHPNYNELVATCSCGNVIKVGSTRTNAIYLDVCSACHPFYTGKQKTVDAGGRIDRFNKRFGAAKKRRLIAPYKSYQFERCGLVVNYAAFFLLVTRLLTIQR